MKVMKLQLLIIAFVLLIAGSAFASLSYDITVNTSSLSGQTGYLYLQYDPINNAVASTATLSGLTMIGGSMGARDTADELSGGAVTGALPSTVVFANTHGLNDYNQAITFGNSLNFILTFASTPKAGTSGVSTFSLGLFADQYGNTPLINTNGGGYAGTGVTVNLNNDGSTSTTSMDSTTTATATPIPAAAWLLGSGLMGLVGIRKKMQN